ncbi:MAG: permease [Candidatus Magnetoglobus multicellularis str. Araruama]|uniref:Permease n=1 Tax=Candidatus Magnetoglobus multicellularis str. Araruama TaxID=890399 RepID=A0A1V1P1F9_9BACT|nr:MAG: permease [Candidatus Magnetoglobus multicellularis str. Araruama]
MVERMKIPRIIAVVLVFVIFMTILLILTVVLLPLLSQQIGQFLQQLPSMIATGQAELMRLPEKYPDLLSEQQLKQIIDSLGNELTNLFQQLFSLSMASVRGAISILIYLVLVPLLVFFFLKDKQLLIAWFTDLLPEESELAYRVWREVNVQTGNYIRGKIWEICIVWGVTYVTFIYFGLQFSMLLAFFVGLSVIIPFIGATVMFVPVALIAYFQWGWASEFAYVMLALSIIQLLDGNLLAPLLLSEVVNLHPVAIIVAVLVFGGMFGFVGLFFAIPLATLVHSIMKAWADHRLESKNI